MFNLEKAVSVWRARLHTSNSLDESEIAELESHLRDGIEALTSSSLSMEEAFLVTSYRLGDTDSLAAEFSKNHSRSEAAEVPALATIAPDSQVYAGFSRRLMALLFDSCTCVLANLLLLAVVATTGDSLAWAVFTAVMLKLLFAVYLLVFTYVHGGTLGKILAGIRICRPDGSALTPAQTFLRNTPYLFLALLELIIFVQILNAPFAVGSPVIYAWIWLGAALLAACWVLASAIFLLRDKHARTLHDHFANTIVVDESYARITSAKPFAWRAAESVWA